MTVRAEDTKPGDCYFVRRWLFLITSVEPANEFYMISTVSSRLDLHKFTVSWNVRLGERVS